MPVSASLSTTSVAPGSSATLSLGAGSAAGGTYAVTVTGSGGGLSHDLPRGYIWCVDKMFQASSDMGGNGLFNAGKQVEVVPTGNVLILRWLLVQNSVPI